MRRAIAKPVVRVITRHRVDCSRKNRGQRVHSCCCLKSLAWTLDGKTFVEPTGFTELADAEAKAKGKQTELDTGVLVQSVNTTPAEAVALFLRTKKDEGIGNKHLVKLEQIFKDEFVGFCERQRVEFIKDVKLTHRYSPSGT